MPIQNKKNIIIFGGTNNAIKICNSINKYYKNKFNIFYSISGITKNPKLPKNAKINVGGFGNKIKFANNLKKNKIDYVIDSTHPFANNFKQKIKNVCMENKINFIAITREHWVEKVGDIWHVVNDYNGVNFYLKKINKPTLFTIGMKNINKINHIPNGSIARMKTQIEHEELVIVNNLGHDNIEEEIKFFKQHNIQCLVTKNSGDKKTYNKIIAARNLKIPVIIIKNPKCNIGYNHKSGIKKIFNKIKLFQ